VYHFRERQNGCRRKPAEQNLPWEVESGAVSPTANARQGAQEDECYEMQNYGDSRGPSQRAILTAEKTSNQENQQAENAWSIKN
jgi:hypothetical protein